ncbi:hypothetical protein C6568_12875 [Melaminivora suipulveris]|uniref:Uncharacterized protein n=1 Tax=Melaminivora suipulveris TaxID=2109913 RepID=A0A2R3QE43_9BURK|nr:hypothetical protein C6568_12875 [Melaminivora suipulveris]
MAPPVAMPPPPIPPPPPPPFPPGPPLPPRPPLPPVRSGPCGGTVRWAGTGSSSSTSRMKLRSETTSAAVSTRRPATMSPAACTASATCSAVPSRITSESAACTASRVRRRRSDVGWAVSPASPASCPDSVVACRARNLRMCQGSTERSPVNEPPSVL